MLKTTIDHVASLGETQEAYIKSLSSNDTQERHRAKAKLVLSAAALNIRDLLKYLSPLRPIRVAMAFRLSAYPDTPRSTEIIQRLLDGVKIEWGDVWAADVYARVYGEFRLPNEMYEHYKALIFDLEEKEDE